MAVRSIPIDDPDRVHRDPYRLVALRDLPADEQAYMVRIGTIGSAELNARGLITYAGVILDRVGSGPDNALDASTAA